MNDLSTSTAEVPQRHPFASQGWCEALFDELRRRLAEVDLTGINWSQGETLVAPPPYVSQGAAEIGWHIVVQDGAVDYRASPGTDLDYVAVIDYERVLPIARMKYAANPDATAQLRQLQESGDGSFRVIGDRARMPKVLAAAFEGLHDAMADRTS